MKFHVDEVVGLGSFIEVEAIEKDGTIWRDKLQEQCTRYLALLGVQNTDLVAESYSDLLIRTCE